MINCSTSLSWCIPWHSSLITLHRLPVTDLLQPAQLLFQQPHPITHQTFNQPSCCSNSHAPSPTRPSTSPVAVPTATPHHPPDLQPAQLLFQQPRPVTHQTFNQPSRCSNSHAQSPTRPSTSQAAVPTATPSHPPHCQHSPQCDWHWTVT